MSVNPKSSAKRCFITFIFAFLIGGAFTYFMLKTHSDLLVPQFHSESAEIHEEEEKGHDHQSEEGDGEEGKEHEHEHEHEALVLSPQALVNIGLEPGEAGVIELKATDFKKRLSFPGFVRYRPGRSLIEVPSPASGVVTKIYAEEGEALCPGEPLFEIQLTHEELTSCQLELLSLLSKRDLLASEQERLSRLATGMEPKTQREIELQTQENEAAISAQKQALLFLGVSEQILEETIIQQRRLLTSLLVRVPELEKSSVGIKLESSEVHLLNGEDHFQKVDHFQQLEKNLIEKGQTVSLGDALCIVSDLRELWIEGKAFESDEATVNSAYSHQAHVSAIFPKAIKDEEFEIVSNLSIRSVSNRIDLASRTFSCFIDLKNYTLNNPHEIHNSSVADKSEIQTKAPLLNWRFKPGQRCEIELETETLSNVFVTPVGAVAQEGAESMLFEYIGEENGNPIWHKRPVVVLYQNSHNVVVANDGSIKEGARVARKGAQQLYIALTNGNGKLQSSCPCEDHDH